MNAEDAAARLNKLFEADPKATDGFFQLCTPCNDELAEDPDFVVSVKYSSSGSWHSPVLRPLGLVNGLIEDRGKRRVAAQFGESSRRLEGFTVVELEDVLPEDHE